MSEANSIVLFGASSRLLTTLSRVLEVAGFVTCSMALADTELAFKEKKAALLLLCHTFLVGDCERAIDLVHSTNPKRSYSPWPLPAVAALKRAMSWSITSADRTKLVETVQTVLH